MSDLREALVVVELALAWALRNNGGECPADYPAGYAKAMQALLLAEQALAALQAEPSAGLDVERLARAIDASLPKWFARASDLSNESAARAIAAEYDRLTAEDAP